MSETANAALTLVYTGFVDVSGLAAHVPVARLFHAVDATCRTHVLAALRDVPLNTRPPPRCEALALLIADAPHRRVYPQSCILIRRATELRAAFDEINAIRERQSATVAGLQECALCYNWLSQRGGVTRATYGWHCYCDECFAEWRRSNAGEATALRAELCPCKCTMKV